MRHDKILKLATLYYSLAKSEELPSNSSDLKTILSSIDSLEGYAARKKYAEKNLKHLSSGSSRLVYLTPQKTIVKLAKNDKGLAQNEAEANPKMTSKFLNKVLSQSNKHVWIEVPFLDKITASDFEDMTSLNFKDFGNALSYGLRKVSDNSELEKPENFDKISKSPIYKELQNIGEKFKLLPGDISRISSWGSKDGHPVLIDAGLTKDIFDKFYDETSA